MNDETKEIVAELSHRCGKWLYVSCVVPSVSTEIHEILSEHFSLIKISHDTVTLKCRFIENFYITGTTGRGSPNDEEANKKEGLSTLFELKFCSDDNKNNASNNNTNTDKVVCKALCTYSNLEMESCGPTLELLETAKEWRQHGLAYELMHQIVRFYKVLFREINTDTYPIKFAACYVSTTYTSRWLQDQLFFDDIDGIREELLRTLSEDDESDFNDEDEDEDEDNED